MTRRSWRASILSLAWISALLVGCAAGTPGSGERGGRPATYEEYDALFADWAPRYVACARQYGADARVTGNGISSPFAEGRVVQDGLDAECLKQVGPPPQAPELTDAFLRGLYQLFVEQAACLAENGYPIPDPPSRDSWVESYGGDSWNPLGEVDRLYSADWDAAARLCPQPDPREADRVGAEIG